jgi:5-methylcytosine-specific restriction protein A
MNLNQLDGLKNDLKTALEKVASEFKSATRETFAKHPLAAFIRNELTEKVSKIIRDEKTSYLLEGSPGKGRWSEVPWVAIFNPLVTETAQSGYYVVYLVSNSGSRIYLSLIQGGTEVRNEFKSKNDYLSILKARSVFLRKRLDDFVGDFPDQIIDLESDAARPEFYEAAHILGKHYNLSEGLPEQVELEKDLKHMCSVYKELIFRGGFFEGSEDAESRDRDDEIIQRREYRLHRTIERKGSYARKVKKHHGTVCQACSFDFGKMYGKNGVGYIDAHHLVPLSELRLGVDYKYSIANDFAVLCANCHRMIHRSKNPSDLNAFKKSINFRNSSC